MNQSSRHATAIERRNDRVRPERAANMRLSVEHFGPIRSGEVEVKPLTVLIGANNSGKTYLAQLIYLLSKTLSARILEIDPNSEVRLINRYMRFRYKEEEGDITYNELDTKIKERFSREIVAFVQELEDALHYSLREYFGVEAAAELSQSGAKSGPFRASLIGPESTALVTIGGEEHPGQVQIANPSMQSLQIPRLSLANRAREDSDVLFVRLMVELSWLRFARDYGVLDHGEYYLPSARSGLIITWPLITSLAVGAVRRRLGFEQIEVGTLSGVTGDFLQQFISDFAEPRKAERSNIPLRPVLEILEQTILKGNVSVEDQGGGRAALLYRNREVNLPLQRTSSMVVELASLDLWLNHLVRPGDLLVIDEPEAHLHPANQRHMARVLVRLINAGVRVVCPTHSSLLVHQLSNHILATEASNDEQLALGFTEDDVLDSQDVAVYLFDDGERGTEIRPVPIIAGFGISEEEFANVAEQIGDETFHLLTSTGTPR